MVLVAFLPSTLEYQTNRVLGAVYTDSSMDQGLTVEARNGLMLMAMPFISSARHNHQYCHQEATEWLEEIDVPFRTIFKTSLFVPDKRQSILRH